MTSYVALLRGINVSGKKKIIMSDLRSILAKANLDNVRTYIQSGNIIFNSKQSESSLTELIQELILKNYKFEVPVIVLKQSFFTQLIKENPFIAKDPKLDIKTLYVAFLAQQPSKEQLAILKSRYKGEDLFVLKGQTIYLQYLKGASKTKLTNNYLETHLKLSATSRNWKTTIKLATI